MRTALVMSVSPYPRRSLREGEAGPFGPRPRRAVRLDRAHAPASGIGAEPDGVVGGRREPGLGLEHRALLLLGAEELAPRPTAALAVELEVVGGRPCNGPPCEQKIARLVVEGDAGGGTPDGGRGQRSRRRGLDDDLLAVGRVAELEGRSALVDHHLGGVPLAGDDVQRRPRGESGGLPAAEIDPVERQGEAVGLGEVEGREVLRGDRGRAADARPHANRLPVDPAVRALELELGRAVTQVPRVEVERLPRRDFARTGRHALPYGLRLHGMHGEQPRRAEGRERRGERETSRAHSSSEAWVIAAFAAATSFSWIWAGTSA